MWGLVKKAKIGGLLSSHHLVVALYRVHIVLQLLLRYISNICKNIT